jgi:TPP-dependent pyruvate/acetoin dehydrogenase alpha subunit
MRRFVCVRNVKVENVLASDAASPLVEATRLKRYRLVLECRLLEQRAYHGFTENLIEGTGDLAGGQEAVVEAARGSSPPRPELAHVARWANGSTAWRN